MAMLTSEEEYNIVAEAGMMEAVWEEEQGAYCIGFRRCSAGGKGPAKYKFEVVEEGDHGKEVGLMTAVRVFNSESGRGLSYKAAAGGGDGGYLLVEAEEAPHVFHLESAEGVSFQAAGSDCSGPFYLIHGPRAGGAGPVAFPCAHDSTSLTLAKADPTRSHGDLPFFLIKAASP